MAGAVADRYGSMRVLSGCAPLYCASLALMAYSTTPGMLNSLAGLMTALGIACSSFTLVMAAFSKSMPPHMRSLAFGAGTAAGSFGQFLFALLAVGVIDLLGGRQALVAFGIITLLVIPLASAVNTPPMDAGAPHESENEQTLRHALIEALGHPSYILLVPAVLT